MLKHAIAALALLPLACTASAEAAPDTAPKPPATPPVPAPAWPRRRLQAHRQGRLRDRPSRHARSQARDLRHQGLRQRRLDRQDIDAEGKAQPPTSGCLDKAYATDLAKSPTAQVQCMPMSPQFTEYQVDGKLVFTQKLCSGQSLDDKSRAALAAAVAKGEAAAKSAP